MNHFQEMVEGRDMWLEGQMAECVGTWPSLPFLPPPAGNTEECMRPRVGAGPALRY